MRYFRSRGALAGVSFAALLLAPAAADAQQTQPVAASDAGVSGDDGVDIVVTANKRAQSINDVALTVTAASGDALLRRGISSTADLAKIVPGLTAQPSPFNTPVYTLRGVGFYESTLSAAPTVAVYTDEVPLPFSAMTKAAALDVERVEVLKGPQGTLFGSNTTGGAINYVAAKPTNSFAAGLDGSFGRFTDADLQAFVSGPLSETVKARLSARVHESGDWQKSYTRSDSLGATRQYQARLLLDWDASSALKLSLNLNGWIDKSDTQAPQRIQNQLVMPTGTNADHILAYPLAPGRARAADWGTYSSLKRDDYFVQAALRADYDLADGVKLTSITAFERYKTRSNSDFDGTTLRIADNVVSGHINTFSQELRVSGQHAGFNWVVGGNYESDRTLDRLGYYFYEQSLSDLGGFPFNFTTNFSRQNVRSTAIFANAEYEVLPRLTIQAGARYTRTRRTFSGCTLDGGDGVTARAFQFLEGVLRPGLPLIPIGANDCFTFDTSFAPIITPLRDKLTEDNVSWRAGINYKTENRGLLYATISKGYKAGSFPTTSASSILQYAPVTQESLVAYEVGFKQPLLDRALQINGAAFYYDYKNKQLRGRLLDLVFGPLDALVQVPKSRVWGLEGELIVSPSRDFTASVAATYLNTRIKKFVGYNNAGVLQDYAGSRFPYAPKLQVVADGQYDFPLSSRLEGYVGSSLTYNSATNGSIGDLDVLRIKSFALLDARIGVKAEDGAWRFEIWGRNLTNSYYWTNALQATDGFVRFAGKPITYGIAFSVRYR